MSRLPFNTAARFEIDPNLIGQKPDRALKNLKYVVSAVNADALKTWNDLWDELKNVATQSGMIYPEMEDGFQPSCGWPDFLEKFWLLKHYLDYINHLCQASPPSP